MDGLMVCFAAFVVSKEITDEDIFLPEEIHPLRKRLAIAAALSLALFVLAWRAEAEIIYTPANITIGEHGVYNLNLDLNHDGVTDFVISSAHFLIGCGYWGQALEDVVIEMPTAGNRAIGSPPTRLTAGEPIGPS